MPIRGDQGPVRESSPLAPMLIGCAALALFAVGGAGAAVYFLSARAASAVSPPIVAPVVPAPVSVSAPSLPPSVPPPSTDLGHGSASDPVPGAPILVAPGDNTQIEGALSHEVITRIVRRHLAEVRFCYEHELEADPTFTARVTAHFTIDATGAVSMSSVDGSDHETLTSCIASRVRTWMFPAPEGGGIVTVNYPFVFSAS